jgi:hypothetical protein
MGKRDRNKSECHFRHSCSVVVAATFAAKSVGGTAWMLDLNASGAASCYGRRSCLVEAILCGGVPGRTEAGSGLGPICGGRL